MSSEDGKVWACHDCGVDALILDDSPAHGCGFDPAFYGKGGPGAEENLRQKIGEPVVRHAGREKNPCSFEQDAQACMWQVMRADTVN